LEEEEKVLKQAAIAGAERVGEFYAEEDSDNDSDFEVRYEAKEDRFTDL
jgi:hypothetical protein